MVFSLPFILSSILLRPMVLLSTFFSLSSEVWALISCRMSCISSIRLFWLIYYSFVKLTVNALHLRSLCRILAREKRSGFSKMSRPRLRRIFQPLSRSIQRSWSALKSQVNVMPTARRSACRLSKLSIISGILSSSFCVLRCIFRFSGSRLTSRMVCTSSMKLSIWNGRGQRL